MRPSTSSLSPDITARADISCKQYKWFLYDAGRSGVFNASTLTNGVDWEGGREAEEGIQLSTLWERAGNTWHPDILYSRIRHKR
ncbi:hypothetical protein J6590_047293 [Homalodisca vitripennis]|nr:hypothetical protein J6590_047293 [Homalodisca vitripennis]